MPYDVLQAHLHVRLAFLRAKQSGQTHAFSPIILNQDSCIIVRLFWLVYFTPCPVVQSGCTRNNITLIGGQHLSGASPEAWLPIMLGMTSITKAVRFVVGPIGCQSTWVVASAHLCPFFKNCTLHFIQEQLVETRGAREVMTLDQCLSSTVRLQAEHIDLFYCLNNLEADKLPATLG